MSTDSVLYTILYVGHGYDKGILNIYSDMSNMICSFFRKWESNGKENPL